MIKAIFFDWGHTFASLTKNREKRINKILKPLDLSWGKLHPLWRQFYILRSAGDIKTDKDFKKYIRLVTKKEIPVEEIVKITIEETFIPKEHIEVVKRLKKNYKVGILSNNVQEWVKQEIKNYKIEKLFDTIVVSSAIGARKPDGVIYYEALKKLSVKAAETAFVADEVSDDLVAASGLGIKTIWFDYPKG